MSASALAAQASSPATAAALERALTESARELAATSDIWEDHSTWENAWLHRSEHFEVTTTTSLGLARSLADGMETMLGQVQKELALRTAPPRRLQVFLYADIADYNRFGEEFGEHHSSFYGSFFASGHPQRPVAVVYQPNATLLRMHLTHSVVHQYVATAFPGVTLDAWLSEGLAAYFSLFWDQAWARAEFARLRASDELFSLRELVSADIDDYSDRSHVRFIQLGTLFSYALHFREDTRTSPPGEEPAQAPFRDYIVATLRGQSTRGTPFEAVMSDLRALQRDFDEFEFP
ncbi:MAG: hypothetical protein AAF628_28835 [Planctomycetota bacterium]